MNVENRQLGNSDLHVSTIGFGTWAAGKRGWGQVDEKEIKAALHYAVERGINFFDTAPIYGRGESERVVGEALAPYRDHVYIATKCGLIWNDQGQMQKHNGKESILKEIDESLKRLHTDYIDLYQVHWPDEKTPIEETMEALMMILETKKVRYLGVSNFSKAQMEEALKYGPIISLQSQYNLLQREVEQEELPFVKERGLGFIPYSPLAQGLLTGKFNDGLTIDEKDVRRHNSLFKEETFEKNRPLMKALMGIAAKYDRPLSQVAINWLLAKPEVSTVICGAKTVRQIEENMAASEWKLSSEDVQWMDALTKR